MSPKRRRAWWAAPLLIGLAGCPSPEATRARGGGRGGDGGNYPSKPVHVPSKIDGTRTWTARPPR